MSGDNFDDLVEDRKLKMIKAALPFLPTNEQKTIFIYIKVEELKNTFRLFNNNSNDIGICSVYAPANLGDMFDAIKCYCTESELEMINTLHNFMRTFELFKTFNSFKNEDNGFDGSSDMFSSVLDNLPPEQQSMFEMFEILKTFNSIKNEDNGSDGSPDMFSSILGMLSPEQQTMFEMFKTSFDT